MEKSFYTEKLKQAFEETQQTRAIIAKETGVSVRTIDYWCSGRSLPNIQELHKIAEIIKKPITWFFGIELNDSAQIKKLEQERDDWKSQAMFLKSLLEKKD